jgi:3-phenylpropionate/cinnamic acid dioxygenase small subunit
MTSVALIASLRDRIEIEELLTLYCTAIDTRQLDLLDRVFTPDAAIDYTRSGGIRAELPRMKEWLAKALDPFVVVQHLVSNFVIHTEDDRGTSVCSFFNPMGLPLPDGSVHTFFCGGFYRDRLLRTPSGWRIHERVSDQRYLHGSLPAGFQIPR